MNSSVTTAEVTAMDQDIFDALNSLIPQLSTESALSTYLEMVDLVQSNASKLFVARDSSTNTIVGSLTLVVYRIPTGIRAWIEDLVVDEKCRGRGIGKLLCNKAIDVAKREGANSIGLTSNPSREPANQLYKSIGFEIRNTNTYRLRLS